MKETDDDALIRSYLDGRPKALKTIGGWIRSVVFHNAWSDLEDAEDAVADTTLKLVTLFRRGEFRRESTLRVYVSRIARYTVIDAIRRARITRESLREENVPLPKPDDPSRTVEEREEAAMFDRIWAIISAPCQRLWQMVFQEGLTYKAIADKENLREAAIKTRFFRCKQEALRIKEELSVKPPTD